MRSRSSGRSSCRSTSTTAEPQATARVSHEPLVQRLPAERSSHPFGTTGGLGRDVLTVVVNGARLSLIIGVGASIFSAIIGAIVGGIAGYFGGWLDNVLMRIVDVLLSLPLLFVILVVSKFLGGGQLGLDHLRLRGCSAGRASPASSGACS